MYVRLDCDCIRYIYIPLALWNAVIMIDLTTDIKWKWIWWIYTMLFLLLPPLSSLKPTFFFSGWRVPHRETLDNSIPYLVRKCHYYWECNVEHKNRSPKDRFGIVQDSQNFRHKLLQERKERAMQYRPTVCYCHLNKRRNYFKVTHTRMLNSLL